MEDLSCRKVNISSPVSHKYEGRNHIEGRHQEIGQRQIEEKIVGDGPHTLVSCNYSPDWTKIKTLNQSTCYDPEDAGVADDGRDEDEGEADGPEDLIVSPVWDLGRPAEKISKLINLLLCKSVCQRYV